MKIATVSRRPRAARAGLTLIELVVVLVVLVALAGILVPMLPSLIQRSHGAAGAGNIAETAKFIQTYEALYGLHPDNYDRLLTAGGAFPSFVVADDSDDLRITEVDAVTVAALNAIGITTVLNFSAAADNATFNPYDDTAEVIELETELVTLTVAGATRLGLNPLGAYVAFGVGGRNTAIGKTMADAPVHFPEAGENPTTIYSRFLAIYEIPAVGPARLATIATLHDDGEELSGMGKHLEEYYESAQLQ